MMAANDPDYLLLLNTIKEVEQIERVYVTVTFRPEPNKKKDYYSHSYHMNGWGAYQILPMHLENLLLISTEELCQHIWKTFRLGYTVGVRWCVLNGGHNDIDGNKVLTYRDLSCYKSSIAAFENLKVVLTKQPFDDWHTVIETLDALIQELPLNPELHPRCFQEFQSYKDQFQFLRDVLQNQIDTNAGLFFTVVAKKDAEKANQKSNGLVLM